MDYAERLRDIKLEQLFESMPVAMVLLDRDGRHVVLNQALASISGTRAADLVGVAVSTMSKESGDNIVRDFKLFDAGEDSPASRSRSGRNFTTYPRVRCGTGTAAPSVRWWPSRISPGSS